jgi:threonine dehydratase
VTTPQLKIDAVKTLGGEVLLHGDSYSDAYEHASQLCERDQLTFVHPFDDPDVIAGQGTVGLEILEELPELDAIVVPIGGGGLISGVALALKAVAPNVRVIGVQARGASPMVQSFRAGRAISVERPDTIAEGIRVGTPGRLTFEVVRACVDECVEVEEAEILEAVVQTMEKSKVVAEAAGVAAVAALIAGRVRDAKRVCAIVSGGNIDLNLLARIIESGLAQSGRTHAIALRLPDTPGQLARVLDVLTEQQCNILDVQHYRSGWRVPLGSVDVEVLVEVRRAGAGVLLDAALRERGFDVRSVGT